MSYHPKINTEYKLIYIKHTFNGTICSLSKINTEYKYI